MKTFAVLSILLSLTVASPVAVAVAAPVADAAAEPIILPEAHEEISKLQARQSTSRNELERGTAGRCPTAILIYARGSTEVGNMGTVAGPPLASRLESFYGSSGIWIQGVGGGYDASLGANSLPAGTSRAAIREATSLFNLARSKCPNTPIVAGGYSQGAALMAATIPDLSSALQNQIRGVVLFGYTKNLQNRGGIPNFPASKTRVYCATGDLVCSGSLVITAAHFTYGSDARGAAATYLRSQIGA